jgi:hypothetical protein
MIAARAWFGVADRRRTLCFVEEQERDNLQRREPWDDIIVIP